VIAPLLFGSSYPFTYTPVFLLILAAGLLTLKSSIGRNAASGLWQFRWQQNPLTPLFLVYVVYLIVTMIPLPAFLLEHVSLVSLVVGGKSLPAASMPDWSVRDFWFATASYIYPVRMSLVRWIVYGVFLWSFMAALDSRKRIESAIIVVLILGCFESLYGIMQAYSGHEHIWWSRKLPEAFGFPAGTYPNRNHFAGLMEMGVILSLAYGMLLYSRHSERKPGKKARLKSIKAKLMHYFSEDQLYTKIVLVVFSGVVMGLGLFLSGSRGGIISLSCALVVMGIIFTSIKKYRRPGLYILIPFLILTAFYTISAGVEPTVERFKLFESSFLNREIRAEKTLTMFNDYPISGVGIGNFPYLFPRYHDISQRSQFINYAHNDWAQLLAEAGVVGFLILLAAMGYYLFKTLRKWKQAQDAFAVCLGIAPAIALISIGIHSLSDFNLHIPANMIVLIAVISIGYRALCAQQDETFAQQPILSLRPSPVSFQPFLMSLRPFPMSFRTYVRNLVFKGSGFLTRLRRFGMTMGVSFQLPFLSFQPFLVSFRPPTLSFRGAKRREILFFSVISTFPHVISHVPSVISNIPHVISNVCEKSLRFLTRLRRFGMTMGMSFRTYVRNLVFKGSGFLTRLRRFGMTMGMSFQLPFLSFQPPLMSFRPFPVSFRPKGEIFKISQSLRSFEMTQAVRSAPRNDIMQRSQDNSHQGFVLMPVRARSILILAVGVLMIVWSGMWVVRHFVAEAYCNTVQTPPLRLDQHPPVPFILEAIHWDGGNAQYQFKLAHALMTKRDQAIENAATEKNDADRIIHVLENAIRINPFTAEYHIRLGWEYSYLWARKDYAEKWLPAADLCMERAAYFNGEGVANYRNHLDMGKYWTMRSKTMDHDPARQDVYWTKARWHFQKALELAGGKKTKAEIVDHVKNFYPDGNYIQEAVQ